MSKTAKVQLLLQKIECEDAILALMKDKRGNDYLFVRSVLEKLISKIDTRLEEIASNV
jgi:hypothetical protein